MYPRRSSRSNPIDLTPIDLEGPEHKLRKKSKVDKGKSKSQPKDKDKLIISEPSTSSGSINTKKVKNHLISENLNSNKHIENRTKNNKREKDLDFKEHIFKDKEKHQVNCNSQSDTDSNSNLKKHKNKTDKQKETSLNIKLNFEASTSGLNNTYPQVKIKHYLHINIYN